MTNREWILERVSNDNLAQAVCDSFDNCCDCPAKFQGCCLEYLAKWMNEECIDNDKDNE